MMLGLDDRISEERRDQLLYRIGVLYDKGVIRVRDWMAIYEILLEACKRDELEAYEDCLRAMIGDGGEC